MRWSEVNFAVTAPASPSVTTSVKVTTFSPSFVEQFQVPAGPVAAGAAAFSSCLGASGLGSSFLGSSFWGSSASS